MIDSEVTWTPRQYRPDAILNVDGVHFGSLLMVAVLSRDVFGTKHIYQHSFNTRGEELILGSATYRPGAQPFLRPRPIDYTAVPGNVLDLARTVALTMIGKPVRLEF